MLWRTEGWEWNVFLFIFSELAFPPHPELSPPCRRSCLLKIKKCLHCRMGHYNSTHAVLEEKKHVFEIALLQVRNVKHSSYFRWQWEPELFLANPTQLTSNEGKRNLCNKVFAMSCIRHLSVLMKRPLTACVLQRAALKSPIFTTECKFSRLAFPTYFPAAVFALP